MLWSVKVDLRIIRWPDHFKVRLIMRFVEIAQIERGKWNASGRSNMLRAHEVVLVHLLLVYPSIHFRYLFLFVKRLEPTALAVVYPLVLFLLLNFADESRCCGVISFQSLFVLNWAVP